MSEDVKVGDRFEVERKIAHDRDEDDWRIGDALRVATLDSTGEAHMMNERTKIESRGFLPEWRLKEGYWRRLPREAPTIEERRAALKVGEVITDPALLAAGMLIDVLPTRRGLTVGQPLVGATEAGSRCASDGMSIGGDWVRRAGVTFLGWAQEEKAGEVEAKPPAGKPDPTPTGLSSAEAIREAHDWMQRLIGPFKDAKPTPVRAPFQPAAQPQPSPPPRGLPFKYMPPWDAPGDTPYRCEDSDKHDGTMCVTCEGIIADIMKRGNKDEATNRAWHARKQRPEPHRPSDTGMGGACGPVMGRLR